jgi:hypothetical protein
MRAREMGSSKISYCWLCWKISIKTADITEIYFNIYKDHTNYNLLINLTNHELAQQLKTILSKSLKFVPTPASTRMQTIVNFFKPFRRSIYVHYHFGNFPNNHQNPFKTKNPFSPPLPDNQTLFSYFASVAQSA